MTTSKLLDLAQKLDFGCPFKEGSIGEYDVPPFERTAQEAAAALREADAVLREIYHPHATSCKWFSGRTMHPCTCGAKEAEQQVRKLLSP